MQKTVSIKCLAVPLLPSRFDNGLRFHYADYPIPHARIFTSFWIFWSLQSLSLSFSHSHPRTHALARTCSHSPFLLLSLFLQLSSCLKSSNGRQVDMLRLNIISAAWNKVRQTNASSSQATKSRINWRWSITDFSLIYGPGLEVRLSMNKSKASPGPSPERRKPFFLVQP